MNLILSLDCEKIENQKLIKRVTSPSDFPLSDYFWIYSTCGYIIRDRYLSHLGTHYRRHRINKLHKYFESWRSHVS